MDKTIGPYRIDSELGRGGMGVVYKAHEEALDRWVAIKVLGDNLAEDLTHIERFKREAQSAAKLNHPNIVQIYSIGEDQGRYYFVMEYVPGTSVLRLIRKRGRIDTIPSCRLVLQAAAGLAAAHDAGIVHRDIKPANLMIDDRGLLKITDFGLALAVEAGTRLTATGMFMGTPGYISPEQCLNHEIDHRTDIYSLGVAFFEMLTGSVPLRAASPLALLKQIVEVQPPDVRELNPEVDDVPREILQHMMVKDRNQRLQSCHELIEQLQKYLTEKGVPLTQSGILIDAAGPRRAPAADVAQQAETTILTGEEQEQDRSVPAPQASGAPRETSPASGHTPPPVPPAPPGSGQEQSAAPAVSPPTLEDDPFVVESLAGVTPAPAAPPRKRNAALVIGLVLATGVLLLLGASAVAYKVGWLDGVVLALRGGEVAAQESSTPAGLETAPTQDAALGLTTDVGGSPEAPASSDSPISSSASTALPSPSTDLQDLPPHAVSGDDSKEEGQLEAAPGRLSPAQSADTKSQISQTSASPEGRASQRSGVRPEESSPPPPRATGITVVAVGEQLLATQIEELLERSIRTRTQAKLVNEKAIPGIDVLLAGDPDLQSLLQSLRPHARIMLLVDAELLTDRQITYLGRHDTVYTSRVSITPFDLASGQALGPGSNDRIEYNSLTVERKSEELLRPRLRHLLQSLRAQH